MKFVDMKSLAHNIADSLASGAGLRTGVMTDVFAEAAKSPDGHITVDLLSGKCIAGRASRGMQSSLKGYSWLVGRMCKEAGFDVSAFRVLEVRFGSDRVYGKRFVVTVESATGKRSTDEYFGMPGKRLRRRRRS